MPINSDNVALQVNHMLLKEEDKKRLVEEVAKLTEAELSMLAGIIGEHDKETMVLLDEKTKEKAVIKDRLVGSLPSQGEFGEKEQEILKAQIATIFSDPTNLSQFLAQADDVLLMKTEEIFMNALADNPEQQAKVKGLLDEARLQKAALSKEAEDEEKKLLIDAIETKKKQIGEMDELIEKVEKALSADSAQDLREEGE